MSVLLVLETSVLLLLREAVLGEHLEDWNVLLLFLGSGMGSGGTRGELLADGSLEIGETAFCDEGPCLGIPSRSASNDSELRHFPA